MIITITRGAEIRLHRQRLGWGQRVLADSLGITDGTLRDIENEIINEPSKLREAEDVLNRIASGELPTTERAA